MADVSEKRTAMSVLFRPRYLAYSARRGLVRVLLRSSRSLKRDGRKVLTIFDPSLIGAGGHHMEYAEIINEEFGHQYNVIFYANFRATAKTILSLHAQPVCEHGTYPPPVISKTFIAQ